MDEEYRQSLMPEEQAQREEAIGFLMNQISCGHAEHAHPGESPDIKCRCLWLLAFQDILKDWVGFTNYGPPSTKKTLTADLLTVPEDKY